MKIKDLREHCCKYTCIKIFLKYNLFIDCDKEIHHEIILNKFKNTNHYFKEVNENFRI